MSKCENILLSSEVKLETSNIKYITTSSNAAAGREEIVFILLCSFLEGEGGSFSLSWSLWRHECSREPLVEENASKTYLSGKSCDSSSQRTVSILIKVD